MYISASWPAVWRASSRPAEAGGSSLSTGEPAVQGVGATSTWSSDRGGRSLSRSARTAWAVAAAPDGECCWVGGVRRFNKGSCWSECVCVWGGGGKSARITGSINSRNFYFNAEMIEDKMLMQCATGRLHVYRKGTLKQEMALSKSLAVPFLCNNHEYSKTIQNFLLIASTPKML